MKWWKSVWALRKKNKDGVEMYECPCGAVLNEEDLEGHEEICDELNKENDNGRDDAGTTD